MTHSAEWIGRSPAITRVSNAEAERWEDTGWEQIVLLYDMLLHLASSPVTRLDRAIAVRYTAGTRAAMAELDDLAGLLGDYHLYHASRAELLRELGHPGQARAADRRALELTSRRRTSQPDRAAVAQDSDLAYNYDYEDDELGSRQDTVLRPGGRSGSDS
jgi:predicted RNA polymerase sigma factor